jgi:hypothetical protein
MAKPAKKEKKAKPKINPEDNPSLNKVGGKLCLRVFEDFYIERDLPKWKAFQANKAALLKEVGAAHFGEKSKLEKYERENPVVAKDLKKHIEGLEAMEKALSDDRWGIQDKHEKEVAASLEKMAVYYGFKPNSVTDRISAAFKRMFGRKERLVPAEVAFADLKAHMELTSSDELAKAKAALDALIGKYARSGQYTKVESVKKLVPQIAHELAIASCGYTKFVTEKQMIDFIAKSERGVRVEFLRYYDGDMPEEVIKKKEEADSKMVFDNYVVAYYGDFVKEAKKEVVKQAEKKKEAATARRRDPILFGVVKQTRKLYYICDWELPEDDLTLDTIEAELGLSVGTLFDPTASKVERENSVMSMNSVDRSDDTTRVVYRALNNYVYSEPEDYALSSNHGFSNRGGTRYFVEAEEDMGPNDSDGYSSR